MGSLTDHPVDPAVDAPASDASVEGFADFYRREYRAVLNVVFALSGSWAVAEELTQDAFVRAHRRWSEVVVHPNRDAWVRRVAINLTHTWLRRRVIEAKALTRLAREPDGVQELPEGAERIWAAVRKLPANQATAVALHYYDDRSIQDVAEIIGCSVATVRVHLHRGRRRLADRLNLELDPEEEE